jgi:hypothetical protein
MINLQSPLLQGCVSLWRVDERSFGGQTLFDQIGQAHGTLNNFPADNSAWQSHLFHRGGKGSLHFDGMDDYVEMEGRETPNAAPLTMMCWFSPEVTKVGAMVGIGGVDVATPHVWELSQRGSGLFRFKAQGLTTATVDSTTFYSNGTNTWYHVAGVEHTSTDRRIYVNGVEEATDTTLATPSASFITRFRIGQTADGQLDEQCRGEIDDVRIYNRALSAQEIRAIYYDGLTGSHSIQVPPWQFTTSGAAVAGSGNLSLLGVA